MTIRLSAKKLFYGAVSIVLSIVFLLLSETYVKNELLGGWINNTVTIIFFMMIMQLFLLKQMTPKTHYLIIAIVILIYLFHFSHIYLQSINYDFGSNVRNNVFFRFPESVVKESTYYGIKGVIGIVIGFTLYYAFSFEQIASHVNEKKDRVNRKRFQNLLCIIGGAADLFYSVISITSSISGGYTNVHTAISGTFYGVRLLSYLLLPGVLMVIQDSNNSSFKKKKEMFLFIIYKIFTMFSGLRAYALINIFFVVYVYLRTNTDFRIKIKYIIFGVILLQLGGGLLIGIRESRIEGVKIDVIAKYMFDIKSNILFNIISEFGITQNVLCIVCDNFNNLPSHGTQFFYSFLTIIPGISYIAPKLNYGAAFMENRFSMHNYGGSFLGDLLYDFGPNLFFISCILFGILLAFIFEWYERKIDRSNIVFVSTVSAIMVEFMFCVRSSLAKMPRMIAWYLTIISFLFIIIFRIRVAKR